VVDKVVEIFIKNHRKFFKVANQEDITKKDIFG